MSCTGHIHTEKRNKKAKSGGSEGKEEREGGSGREKMGKTPETERDRESQIRTEKQQPKTDIYSHDMTSRTTQKSLENTDKTLIPHVNNAM